MTELSTSSFSLHEERGGGRRRERRFDSEPPAPYLSNHLRHVIPLAPFHRDAPQTAVRFSGAFCCGVTPSDG